MVTPEIVTPLEAGEAKPMPDMLMKFLEPVRPGESLKYDGTIQKKE